MAQKRARLFGGEATLITYEFDESTLSSDLKIKRFPEKASYSPEQAALLLQDKYLDQKYYFGTDKALCFLHKINVETV